MTIQRLLNISTHPGEPEHLFHNDWEQAGSFLVQWGFDGFELYPVGDYPCELIPTRIVTGLHLRFFIILAPLWRGDQQRLLKIFGDWQTVEQYYGGRDADWITTFYRQQLELARHLECAYVVFHPVHCELEYIYDWRFPWSVHDTLDMCAEVVNAATTGTEYKGLILFENLWWPGSFRLDSPEEYDYLLQRVNYPRCGIVLDTGHLLNKNPALMDERQAVDFLLRSIKDLGDTARHIHALHLSKSLSGKYIHNSLGLVNPFKGAETFWQRLHRAREHVARIDRHEAFETPRIAAVLEKLDPAYVVFEFTFDGKPQWEQKIRVQKKALMRYLWPSTNNW
ncbi:MAG: TIM barrel protein [Desulfosoma sp.]|uniref:TIM barrel protein n=1 Tax=Desulfosoma sp. TaxID=2603217 RepID=UPI0040496266